MQSFKEVSEKYSVWPQLLASLSASLAMASGGASLGWMSPAMTHLSNPVFDYRLDSDQISWIASMLPLGFAVGPLITLNLVDRIGRKKTQLVASIFYISGWLITLLAHGFIGFAFARFLIGLGCGITASSSPIYVAEISENKRRGAMLALSCSFVSVGALYSSIIGPRTTLLGLSISVSLIPVLLVATFIFAPESPYFYEKTGRRKEALKSLMKLRGVKKEETVVKEFASISLFLERDVTFGFVDTLKEITKIRNLKILFLAMVIYFGEQFSGSFAISSYTEKIFRDIDSPLNPPDAVAVLASTNLLFFWISSAVVDCGGRKLLLLISCVGACAMNLLTGTYLLLSQRGIIDASFSWMAMIGIFGFTMSMALGLFPVPNVIISEMFPASIKSWSICIICSYQTVLSFVVTKLFQVIDSAFGGFVAFYLFAFCLFLTGVYIYFLAPETKKMTFNDIQEKLTDRDNTS